MPFDMTPIDTPLARRRQLIDALRNEMTPGFSWNFGIITDNFEHPECATAGCAMGLAMKMWPDYIIQNDPISLLAEFIGITPEQATSCFDGWSYGQPFHLITPQMVADKLENLIDV
jgi:hypothetical protein